MFTGLVEETGTIVRADHKEGGVTFLIRAKRVMPRLAVDHSIAVDGVCLTVVKRDKRTFAVQAVEETLRKTTLGRLAAGDRVNLERPLLPSSRLGGHFVLGHVDGKGKVLSVETRGSSWWYVFEAPKRFAHHLIPVGSIAVQGVSLTMADVKGTRFAVSIIPHTMEQTTFPDLKKGDTVNLEFDVLGKFVENFLKVRRK